MRINKFVAGATCLSRRGADQAIKTGRVMINQRLAQLTDSVTKTDVVTLDGQGVHLPDRTTTLLFNKPVGYVCSRRGQGSRTIYDLIPAEYHTLKPAGRLDKDSSGLLILTDDGALAQQLTHPRHNKTKLYHIELQQPLQPAHQQLLNGPGAQLEDGPSQLALAKLDESDRRWEVAMREGRNRQIRRSFAALGYEVTKLERLAIGDYQLGDLSAGQFRILYKE